MCNYLIQAGIFVFHGEQACSGDLFPERKNVKDSNSPPYLKFEHTAREQKKTMGSGNLFTLSFVYLSFLKCFIYFIYSTPVMNHFNDALIRLFFINIDLTHFIHLKLYFFDKAKSVQL